MTQMSTGSDLRVLPAAWKMEPARRGSFVFAKNRSSRLSSRRVALRVPSDPNYQVVPINQGQDYGDMAEIDPSTELDSSYHHTDTDSGDSVSRTAAKIKII